MTLEDFENFGAGLFHLIGAIGIVIGGIWGLVEYYDAKHIAQTKETQKYIQLLSTSNVKESETFLIKYWSSYDWESAKDKNKKDEIIRIVSSNPEYQIHLKNLFLFLGQLANCVEQEICEKELVISNFEGLFLSAFVNHRHWVYSVRENTGHTDYYDKLECFILNNYPATTDKLNCQSS